MFFVNINSVCFSGKYEKILLENVIQKLISIYDKM